MKRISKKLKIGVLSLMIIGAAAFGFLYLQVYASNTDFSEDSKIVYVAENIEVESWINDPNQKWIRDEASFLRVSGWKKLKTLTQGRYRFKKGMSNNAMVNMLRIGSQAGITIRIDDCQNMFELAGRLGKYLQKDSAQFIAVFANPEVCKKYSCEPLTLSCIVVPDTYEFLWTNTPEDVLKRMDGIRKKYWNDVNIIKAKSIHLSPNEVCILASIVKAECSRVDEAPKIAGLYLNRLRIDMPLQADPTAVFASGLRGVDRVYSAMTEVDSPFNTYRNKGLPPGPIRLVESVYLDAVLHAAQHDYLYMCAQPGSTGYHNFAKSYDQHLEYQRSYTDWLNKKGIR
ncbi:MAG: endolytic transglycosylase MltG [Flavobacteriales bacterium]